LCGTEIIDVGDLPETIRSPLVSPPAVEAGDMTLSAAVAAVENQVATEWLRQLCWHTFCSAPDGLTFLAGLLQELDDMRPELTHRGAWLVGCAAVIEALGCAPTFPNGQAPLANETLRYPPVRPALAAQRLVPSSANPTAATGAMPLADAVVDARVLIITTDGSDSSFGAIQSTLQYLGTPFDVLNATTGPTLTADMLASGTQGKYEAIFLDTGDLSVGGPAPSRPTSGARCRRTRLSSLSVAFRSTRRRRRRTV
jgi:hypothetical protein